MSKNITHGFEVETIELNLEQIMPLKTLSKSNLKSRKFEQIVSSIKEIGIIEPIVVSRPPSQADQYILLDGHMRMEALKQMGETKTICLISSDDESFTYNKYISRKTPIQEHRMITNMVKNGVSEEKIARVLNLDIKSIIHKRYMLDGICPEAIDLLKDKMVARKSFEYLKKMRSLHQIECANLMVAMNDFTLRCVQGLYENSDDSQLKEPKKRKKTSTLSAEQQAQMEEQLDKLQREYKLIKDERGQKNLTLQFSKNYLERLLANNLVERFLSQHYPDILEEFQKITDMVSLKTSSPDKTEADAQS